MGGVVEQSSDPTRSPPSLEVLYTELNRLLLESPDLGHFVRQLAALAASVVPGTRCVIALRRVRLAGNTTGDAGRNSGRADPRAAQDEVWIPLLVDGADVGTMRILPVARSTFSQTEQDRLKAFTHQAAVALILLLRQSAHTTLDAQLQDALATRAVIDQALGVLMHARKISSRQAFEILRHASQTRNRKVSTIAAELIETMTGHPPEPPRPLAQRDIVLPVDPTDS